MNRTRAEVATTATVTFPAGTTSGNFDEQFHQKIAAATPNVTICSGRLHGDTMTVTVYSTVRGDSSIEQRARHAATLRGTVTDTVRALCDTATVTWSETTTRDLVPARI
jgi:hypothetical protein